MLRQERSHLITLEHLQALTLEEKGFGNSCLRKCALKLRSFGLKFFSLSGRLVLLKALISVIRVYHMSLFLASFEVIGDMKKLMRAFLWGRADRACRIPWIAYGNKREKTLKREFLASGFGARKIKHYCLKQAWIFGKEKQALWRRVICINYGWDDHILLLHSMTYNINWCSTLCRLSGHPQGGIRRHNYCKSVQ